MTNGERIKKARKDAGLTQDELGKKLGISGAAIAQYETGRRFAKIETLERIANALGVRIYTLDDNLLRDNRDIDNHGPNRAEVQIINDDWSIINISTETPEGELIFAFQQLNEVGQQKAIERVYELAELEKYQIKSKDEVPAPMTREQYHAELDRQLDDEEKAEENSSASGRPASGSAGA